MPRLCSDARHPVDPPVGPQAVKQEPAKFPLQLGLRLQQFRPQALRRGDEALTRVADRCRVHGAI